MSENKKMVIMLSSFVVIIGAGIGYYLWNEKKKKNNQLAQK